MSNILIMDDHELWLLVFLLSFCVNLPDPCLFLPSQAQAFSFSLFLSFYFIHEIWMFVVVAVSGTLFAPLFLVCVAAYKCVCMCVCFVVVVVDVE